jgi:hypothetical protein
MAESVVGFINTTAYVVFMVAGMFVCKVSEVRGVP